MFMPTGCPGDSAARFNQEFPAISHRDISQMVCLQANAGNLTG